VGIEPDLMVAYETTVCTSSSSPQRKNLVDPDGIEPSNAALSERCLSHSASGQWFRIRDLNSAVCLTKAADRHQSLPGVKLGPRRGLEPRSLVYETSTSPSMLARQIWGLHPASNRDQSNINRRTCPLNLQRQTTRRRPTVGPRLPEGSRRESNPDLRQLGAGNGTRTHDIDLGNVALCH
jgi:hypothetical protein